MEISTGCVKIEAKNNFMKKLDKLFDISFCKCKIELCPEKKCTCKDNVHNQFWSSGSLNLKETKLGALDNYKLEIQISQ